MNPEVIAAPARMRERSRSAHARGLRVGFVPTMGYLHEGHMSLVRRARSECSFTVVSIFVNPAQFGPGEDFDRYPRDLHRDLDMLRRAEADVVFHPEVSDLYPAGAEAHRTWVAVKGLSEALCGAPGRRGPAHFRGVTTAVAKLLNIVEPDAAFFGQKDAQQALIVQTMARELNMSARIEICPTVREADGLAMSSRNKYLSEAERAAAPAIYRALSGAVEAAASGESSPRALLERVRAALAGEPLFRTEYVELVELSDLKPVQGEAIHGRALLAVAGRLGQTRLIDNVIVAVKD
ncbi:MAG TPA: pantoate--beta-alanine ligase [Candidatus Polarisedimenticolia bacterium]|jgi:pantoate--beta-alanine ligase